MPAVILQGEAHIQQELRIPEWVVDLRSFSRWVDSDEFPEEGRIDYLQGAVWVDMSKEQVYEHTQVKTEFTFVPVELVRAGRLSFEVLRHTARGYVASRKQPHGWVKSQVFGKSFRLTRQANRFRHQVCRAVCSLQRRSLLSQPG